MNIRVIATNEEGYHATLFPQTSFPTSGPSAEWLTENGCEEVVYPDPVPYVQTYADKRRMEYPPIQDYIDGVVKDDAVQIQNYIDACLAVKAKYPKVV